MSAPLMLGNDIRKFVDGNNNAVEGNSTLKIVTNKHLISVDQDPLGKSAKRLKKINGVDVLARPLANGDIAVCLLNNTRSNKTVKLEISQLAEDKYLDFVKLSTYEVHDLWSDERLSTSTITSTLPKHSVNVYRIKPEK
jgi:alpha-galactosidase